MRLSSTLRHQRDAMRRYGRRGLARRILHEERTRSKDDLEHFYDTHEIASEFRGVYGNKKLDYWAQERNPVSQPGGGTFVFGMSVPCGHPKAASWPK